MKKNCYLHGKRFIQEIKLEKKNFFSKSFFVSKKIRKGINGSMNP